MVRRVVWMGLLSLLLQGCGTDLESVLQLTYPLLSGDYGIGYHGVEGRWGLGQSAMTADGSLEGDIIAPDGGRYTVTGSLTSSFEYAFEITGPGGPVDFQWEGGTIAEDGVIEGSFVLDGQDASFAGSKNNTITEGDANTLFDGSYDLTASLGDEDRGSTVFHIDQGLFDFELADVDDNLFEAEGYVTSDGTVVMGELTSSTGDSFLAEANIDQDTFAIEGLFRVGDAVGSLTGGRAD